jgi:hypothetical protein
MSVGLFPDSWMEAFNEVELERLAIMTVDGGLTDDEALMASGLFSKLPMENGCLTI